MEMIGRYTVWVLTLLVMLLVGVWIADIGYCIAMEVVAREAGTSPYLSEPGIMFRVALPVGLWFAVSAVAAFAASE